MGGQRKRRILDRYIDLNRQFSDLTDEERADPGLLAQPDRYGFVRGSAGWPELVQSERVVILAEAGSGKSWELQAQQERLTGQELPAFYIPIEALQSEDVESLLAMQIGEVEAYKAWRSNPAQEAWIFLDAVDELKLTSGKLDLALGKVARTLGAAADRAHVILTCRPSDWRPVKDLECLQSRLPVSQDREDVSAIGDDAFLQGFRERKPIKRNDDTTKKLRVVVLNPLTDAQIKQYAEAKGIADSEALIREIRRRDAWSFARRPFDLDGLIRMWRDDKRLGTRREQHESDVGLSLKDDPDRADKGVLSEDKARDGAERLALALALTKNRTIRVPDGTVSDGLERGMLDVDSILTDWTEAERQALLRRPIFDVATYGRVGFHHRSVAEYLAACRLKNLSERGLTKRRLMRQLFGDRYGARVTIPSMRPIAAWLALLDSDVLQEILNIEPETLVSFGDAESLDLPARRELVRQYVRQHGDGSWRGLNLSIEDVQRLAHSDLSDEIMERWAGSHSNDEVRNFLLKLVWLGGIAVCADIALSAAIDDDLSVYTRSLGIRSLVECDRTDLLRVIADDVNENPARWPDEIVHDLPDHLYPQVISTAELAYLLKSRPESKDTVGGFSWTLANQVDRLAPGSEPAVALRSALADLVLSGWEPTSTWYEPRSSFGFLSPALSKLCFRELERGGAADHVLVRDATIARCFHHDQTLGHAENREMGRFFEPGCILRPLAHAAELNLALVITANDEPGHQLYCAHRHGLVPDLGPADWNWLLAEFNTSPNAGCRAPLFQGLLHVLGRDGPADREAALREVVAGEPNFISLIDGLKDPRPPPNPELADMEKRHAAFVEKQGRAQKKRDKDWLAWRDKVRSNPGAAFTGKGGGDNLWITVRWLQHRGSRDSKNAQSNWGEVRALYGDAVADSFEAGAKAYWREESPEIWSRKPPEDRSRSTYRPYVALTGLAIEAASGNDWARRLSPAEAEIATGWATTELNGLPEWFEDVVEAHPESVRVVLERELCAEFDLIQTLPHPRTLSAIEYGHSDPVRILIAPFLKAQLLDWPETLKEVDAMATLQNLDRYLAILGRSSSGDEGIGAFCEKRFKGDLSGPLASSWLRGVFSNDFSAGVLALRYGLAANTDPEMRREHGLRWFAGLFANRMYRQPTVDIHAHAELLFELTTLAHECIRREDDVHHEGAYSPDLRDHAESARDTVLSALIELPGQEAHDALLRLAELPLFAHMPDRLRRLARDRAAADSETHTLSPAEYRSWERVGHQPRNNDELFIVVADRLDDLDYDVRHHSFSTREQWRALTDEKDLQPHVARYFHDHRRDHYSVTRESKGADNRLTDVLLSTPAVGSATVEIKVGDRCSVTQLEAAIEEQLVGRYLRHPDCRVGHLLVTYAGRKGFEHPLTGEAMKFDEVVAHLRKRAVEVERQNPNGIRLGVAGLDLRPPLEVAYEGPSRLRRRVPKRGRRSPVA